MITTERLDLAFDEQRLGDLLLRDEGPEPEPEPEPDSPEEPFVFVLPS